MAAFLSILKIAHVSRVIDEPCLHSQSFLPITFPLALVPIALRIEHDAETFSSVIDPVTLVGIPLRVDESSETLLHSQLPFALVERPIRVLHDAFALPNERLLAVKNELASIEVSCIVDVDQGVMVPRTSLSIAPRTAS